ncbi:MAG: hypothetical protein IM638_19465 [Bacteroidetes bacterium]|nr:hypothetical protein [Bacteroidota bacterium]
MYKFTEELERKAGAKRYLIATKGSLLLFFILLFTPSLSAVTITNRPATIEDLAGKIPPQNSIGGNPAPTTHCIQVVDFGGDGIRTC